MARRKRIGKEDTIINHHNTYFTGELGKNVFLGILLLLAVIATINYVQHEHTMELKEINVIQTMFKDCTKACSKDYHVNHMARKDNYGKLDKEGQYRFIRDTPIYEDFDRTPCIKTCTKMIGLI